MYKIFLVEDEPPILEMIKGMIDTRDYDFKVIGSAYNGREALKSLVSNPPDVIITDIKMPFVDGLTLIAEVNKLFPNIKSVILSGYSDFEYARSALRLKVFDYILKPVHPDGLGAVLNRLADLLDQEKMGQEYTILSALINFGESGETQVNLPPYYYYPMIICAGNISNQLYDLISPGREFWLNTGMKILSEWRNNLPLKSWLFHGVCPNEKILLIASLEDNYIPLKTHCQQLMTILKNDQIAISIISGSAVNDVYQIRTALKQLRSLLAKQIVFGQSRVFNEEIASTDNIKINSEIEKRFKVLAQQSEFGSFKQRFKVMADEWQEQCISQVQLEHVLDQLNETFIQQGPLLIKFEIQVNEVLASSKNYHELFDSFSNAFKNYFDLKVEKQINKSAKELVDKIEEYLNQHYTENFTYKMFYNLFGYNETYITNVFRNIKGISPSKYVTKLRMEKAKELINAEPEILLKVVSEMVGYDDPLYFSRVFKDTTGFSPSEYIKQTKKS